MARTEVPLVLAFAGVDVQADHVAVKGPGEKIPLDATMYLRLAGSDEAEIKVPVDQRFVAALLGEATEDPDPGEPDVIRQASTLAPIPVAVKVIIDTDTARHPL